MNIKLIASDLDGTLLTGKKEITPYTREVLQKTAEQGCMFVPATGRAFSAVPREVLELPGAEYVISSNGAAIYSISQGKRIYRCLLSERSVESMLALPLSEEIAMEAFLEGVPYSQEEVVADPGHFGATGYGIQYVQRTRKRVKDIRAFVRMHIGELDGLSFISGVPEKLAELRRILERDITDIHLTTSMSHMLEIGHENGGKGNTLVHLLKTLGMSPDEAMAFGDADNDREMLSAVKYGIAMGNAEVCCKQAAYAVTLSNEEEGVARAVERYLGWTGDHYHENHKRKNNRIW